MRKVKVYMQSDRTFKTPQDMVDKFEEYCQKCIEHEKTLTHAGFAAFCGISKETLKTYNGKTDEYTEVYGVITAIIEDEWLQTGVKDGKLTGVMQTYLNNNCNYVYGKQEVHSEITQKIDITGKSTIELESKLSNFMLNHPEFVKLQELPEGDFDEVE